MRDVGVGRDTSAAAVDGATQSRGHHEAVGERQGRQPGPPEHKRTTNDKTEALRAERDELETRWLGMRDCYDREVIRGGKAERERDEALARVAGLEAREASLRDALRTYVTEIARAASTLAECDEDTAAVVVSALGYLGALQPGHAEDEVDDAVLTLRAALADSDEAGS